MNVFKPELSKRILMCRCTVHNIHAGARLCLTAQVLIRAGKPVQWPLSNIWRPGNYLCKSRPVKSKKTNKGGLSEARSIFQYTTP